MILLDGKKTSSDIKDEITLEVLQLKKEGKKTPHLAAVIVGNDGASKTYVGAKVKACNRVGFSSTLVELSKDTSEASLLSKIGELNNDDDIDGFIVQLPLPKHIDEQKILMAVNPDKDVDGFHPTNVGKMALNLPTFISATPLLRLTCKSFGTVTIYPDINASKKGTHFFKVLDVLFLYHSGIKFLAGKSGLPLKDSYCIVFLDN